ncbi:MAG TPA: hypothetical protein ENI55_05620 [Alphaproteobacteria bacterium]|nr:hypothetical protein [Alphaproteobacteria bacterium]
MPRRKKSPLSFAVPVVLLALSGCSILDVNTPILPCPETRVLGDVGSFTRFRAGPGRDLSDITFEGRIAKSIASCEYSISRDSGKGTLSVTMNVVFEAIRGPAARKNNVAFGYFAAVTDTSENIISKDTFKMDIKFPANVTRLKRQGKKIILNIPLGPKDDGSEFTVFTGFRLSGEELKFNRANGQRLLRQ